jgi:uncharacterized protein YdhG (YjbR/CyaY superfamily)
MQSKATTPEQYIRELPEDRKQAVIKLRETVLENIPEGFEEQMSYGMLGYVVPHNLYPPGYHCDPALPLPFVNIASQKNCIAVYHMGMYVIPALYKWFMEAYPQYSTVKPDMGKSCIRFKKAEHIPYALIAALMKKITVKAWIAVYEENLKPKKSK